MSALTSLIHLSTVNWIDMFFVAVSEEEPFISHAEALVDALLVSNPEKSASMRWLNWQGQQRSSTIGMKFRTASHTTFGHAWYGYSKHTGASSLLSVLRNVEMTCIIDLASRIFSLPSLTHTLSWPPMFPLYLSIGIIIR